MSAQQAKYENIEYIVTNSVSLLATTTTVFYICRNPEVKKVLLWFIELLTIMAFGYASRITFQALNLKYFQSENNDSETITQIWIVFPFAWGTALVPIGFSLFAFRYFEVTSLNQVTVNQRSNQFQISSRIRNYRTAVIIELATGVCL